MLNFFQFVDVRNGIWIPNKGAEHKDGRVNVKYNLIVKLTIGVAKQFLGLRTGFNVSRPGVVRVTLMYLNEETNSRGEPSRSREGRVLRM